MSSSSTNSYSRIVEIALLASEKLDLVKSQISQFEQTLLKTSPTPCIKGLEEGKYSTGPRSSEGEATGNPFQTAWEKWCNAKYGSRKKVPFDLVNSNEHASFNRENIDPTPVSNINCRSRNEMMIIFQRWHAWATTQKLLYKNFTMIS